MRNPFPRIIHGRTARFLKRQLPKRNFLFYHYVYIILAVLIGSACLGIGSELAYIDALFLSASACTQAGLNPVNLNTLNKFQQAMLYVLPMFTNVVAIHSAVVIIRLYWFNKRFSSLILDMKQGVGTFSRVKTGEDNRIDEKEIRGRPIQKESIKVLHPEMKKDLLRSQVDNMTNGNGLVRRHSHTAGDEYAIKDSDDEEEEDDDVKDEEMVKAKTLITENGSRSVPNTTTMGTLDTLNTHRPSIDEILDQTSSPQQAETPQNIRFGDLPQPSHKQQDFAHSRRPSMHTNPDKPYVVPSPQEVERMSAKERMGSLPNPLRKVSEHMADRSRTKSTDRSLPRATTFDKIINGLSQRKRANSMSSQRSTRSLPYLSYNPTIGRNSIFINLTQEQREELGGIEYRALIALAWILAGYFFLLHLFGMICFLAFIQTAKGSRSVVQGDNISSGWWAIFTSASVFNDLGLTLTPNSFISFQRAAFLLIIASFLIVAGNTGFPCVLRFVVWLIFKSLPQKSRKRETMNFILDHPRRCFTLLFPANITWWLFWILVGLNALDLFFFIILDLNDPVVTSIPVGFRIICGAFQAFSTRTAGFSVVNLAELHPAITVSYLIMMYISVFPIAISIRRTNVYEEKSLGIYEDDAEDDTGKEISFVGTHVRRQLSHDLWYLALALFIICIVEDFKISETNDYYFNIWSILFECVSAYGTVGLSLGYPNTDTSFSAQFKTLSKLVIIALQIRGRHRGLPYAIDRAVLLPGEKARRLDEGNKPERRLSMARSM